MSSPPDVWMSIILGFTSRFFTGMVFLRNQKLVDFIGQELFQWMFMD